MNLRGGGATYNQAPSSVLAESNGIKRHPEPKAKDLIKKQEDSSVASLLQNDVQGTGKFFGLCAKNDKAAQGDSSGFRPQNDMTHCDEPIRSDLSDENTQNPKCRDSEVNNNCRQGKRQRRVLSERSEFTRQNAESSKLLANAACGWFCGTFATKSAPVRRTKQKPEVDSSVASLLQNDVQGAWEFLGLCLQNDKAEREDSSGIRPQNDIKKDVILSQRRRIPLKRNWIFHSVQNDRKKSKHAAFTMAEVLITLGIIGIVAAMTMPMLINKAQKMILAQQFKKMYTNIQNTINLIQADWGAPFECYNTGFGEYHLTECDVFWEKFLSKYQILQTCEREDYDCHPEYKSKAEVLAEGGEVINNHCTLDYPNGVFYILSDGSYIIVNTKISEIPIEHHAVFFLIDVNGAKGPNRWGYDVFYITLNRENMKTDVIVANEVCAMKEKGGMYINEILLK